MQRSITVGDGRDKFATGLESSKGFVFLWNRKSFMRLPHISAALVPRNALILLTEHVRAKNETI